MLRSGSLSPGIVWISRDVAIFSHSWLSTRKTIFLNSNRNLEFGRSAGPSNGTITPGNYLSGQHLKISDFSCWSICGIPYRLSFNCRRDQKWFVNKATWLEYIIRSIFWRIALLDLIRNNSSFVICKGKPNSLLVIAYY